jgi:uncharacterized SAM-binding protein YcdF (DUF218 family)
MSRRDFAAGLAVGAASSLLADSLELHSALSYWGPRAPWVAALALAGALLWSTRLRPLLAAGAAGLGLLWLAVAFTPLTSWMAQGLVRRDELRPADAVVVLASSLQRDGELTPTSMSRLLHGLELVSQGRAPRLVLTEIAAPARSHAEPARALLRALHISTELLVVGPVYNTRDEAALVKRLFAQRGFVTLVLVTSPTHTLRAAATFEKQGLTVLCSPSVETRFDLETLATADDRLRGFSPVLHERLGLLLYRLRGDLSRH